MIIEVLKASNELSVIFEEHDFRLKDNNRNEIWIEAKEAIKERFPYPEGRYDGERKAWIIKDSDSARRGIEAIKKRYFGDENQAELF